MLGKVEQESMTLSPYSELFDILIEKDDFWRVLNEMVDFGFIYDVVVKEKYSNSMEDLQKIQSSCLNIFY